jgi:AcrR family transcriptional regulator
MTAPTSTRRQRSDGERSRRTILQTAARLATLEGLDGISIARLAEASGMSKGGLYAHFGSKESLQLATIETAWAIFDEEVVDRATAAPEGRERLLALTDAFLDHLERRVFPGGCFFANASAEFAARPGPVQAEIGRFMASWKTLIAGLIAEARDRGELDGDTDVEQLAFEIRAMLMAANFTYLAGGADVLRLARTGIESRLAA